MFGRIAAVHFPLRVNIQRSIDTKDKFGGTKHAWVNISGMTGIPGTVVPASAIESRGREVVRSETTHRLMLGGYFPAIKPEMRISADNGAVYDITGIESDPWHTFTQLQARIVTT